MKYTPRPYQEKAIQAGVDFFFDKKKKNKRAVIVLPTAGGKSLVISELAVRCNTKIVVFSPSKELLGQNVEKFETYGFEASVYSASFKRKEVGNVTFCTIGSVKNCAELFHECKLVIIDECHLVNPEEAGMYMKFFGSFPIQPKVIGLTATPVRLKQYNFPQPHCKVCMIDRMKPKFFNEYIHVTQIQELYDLGFLTRVKYIPIEFDARSLEVNSTGRDFTDASMAQAFEDNLTIRQIAEMHDKIVDKGVIKHLLIFVPSIANAEELMKMCPNIEMVNGKTPDKERDSLIKRFKSGELFCVVNVGVLTTGFDFPELDGIIMARPTMSLALYYQIVGRLIRIHPDKSLSYLIDLSGNFNRFGEVDKFVIEPRNGNWVIHNGVSILTNVEVQNPEKIDKSEEVINFGKYKGMTLKEIPVNYLLFLYNGERNLRNKYIYDYVENNILVDNLSQM